jgi:Tfp pilus assembly protein PilN
MLKTYYRINEAMGIDIHIAADGSAELNACAVSVDKNQLSITQKATGLLAAEELKKNFTVKYIAVNLSGKGVLHKQIALLDEITEHNFGSIFLNANIHDFYVQHLRSGDRSFVSIVRRAEADKWLRTLENAGYTPLILSLGPFPVEQIQDQLNIYEGSLVFNGHAIERGTKKEWLSYRHAAAQQAPFPIKLGLERLPEKLVLAYATAFQLVLADRLQLTAAGVPDTDERRAAIFAKKKLTVNAAAILGAFFVLLLVNFILFSSLYSDNNRLEDQVGQLTASSISVQGVQDQVTQKVALLKALGWDGGINKSVLVDQLASLMPEEITLDEVAINPPDPEQSRLQKTLTFHDGTITLTGHADKIIPLNEWIARIKTKAWVKNIQLDSYAFNNELNTGIFTVIINYQDAEKTTP